MAPVSRQPSRAAVWAIARRQHDRVTYEQLVSLGMTADAIHHRIKIGLLYRERRGVFAVSRPRGTNEELWMTSVLACGAEAVLSGEGALIHWREGKERVRRIEISVPHHVHLSPAGLLVRRRPSVLPAERRVRDFIPVTSPALTVIDNANRLGREGTEAAINDMSNLGRATPNVIRATAERYPRIPGSRLVRDILDRLTFRMTDSELERMFLRLVRRAGLPLPLTQVAQAGGRVDFIWRDHGLIAETDSLTYHRTASQQAADARRDQAHAMKGTRTLRFTHADVRYEPHRVEATLEAVIGRLAA